MALRHYVEYINGWVCPDASHDDQWNPYDLSVFGVPPSAVVEISIGFPRSNAEYYGGVRKTGSSLNRRIRIAEAEGDGENFSTMMVQADASGYIEYYSDYFDSTYPSVVAPNFRVVGWWLGCTYIEKFDSFGATSADTWEGYALDQYGIGSGNVADFALSNDNIDTGFEIGIRSSGSTLEKKLRVKEAEGGGEIALNLSAIASGTTAAVEIYAGSIADCSFYLLGYFSVPPGDYVEDFTSFPVPELPDSTWQTLDVGSSGIANSGVAQFVLGNSSTNSPNELGVRNTYSSLNRTVNVDESETGGTTTGKNFGSLCSIVDSSGYVKYFSSDEATNPDFISVGYWTNFANSDIPFLNFNSTDCFIQGLNPYAHYIERLSSESDFFVAPSGSDWVEYDLSSMVPASTDNCSITAEIGIRNSSVTATHLAGARSTSSQINRYFELHDAESGGYDFISLLVPVDNQAKIHIYTDNISDIEFAVFGYWVGGIYHDTHDLFQINSEYTWVNHNVGTTYANKVAEIVITNYNSVQESGGVRSVGSSIDRHHQISKAETGKNHTTLHVNTSGNNGTIQAYISNSGNMSFTAIGYWSTAPGQYHETFSELTSPTENNVWTLSDTGTAEGSVTEMVLEQRYNIAERLMGAREVYSNNSRIWDIRETDLPAVDLAGNMHRVFVNVSSGTSIELYHESPIFAHAFRMVGYWDDLQFIPNINSGNIPLFTAGFDSYNVLDDSEYPSGLLLYCDGHLVHDQSGSLYTDGFGFIATDDQFGGQYPSGVSLYVEGEGISSISDSANLFVHGLVLHNDQLNLYTDAYGVDSNSSDLFLKTIDVISESISLILYNPVDTSSGLIGEDNAVFYLSRRHDNWTSTATERIEHKTWEFPKIIIGNRVFLGKPGATQTVGDGTLPGYDDMGGGFSSCRFGQALIGPIVNRQNILGHVVSPSDYPYAGSSSITTAFWMSGANTSGNIVEAGWFHRDGDFDTEGPSLNTHTLGVKITSDSGLQVWSSIRDVPYEQASGGGLWWGGTTHYGTPIGSDWSWNTEVDSLYWSWNEKWPEIHVEHGDVAFFAIHADFVDSGVDGNNPNHVKIYLSVDGQPWLYIGSGLTGPPASSLYNYEDPRSRYSENAVGIKVQAINYDAQDESLCVNEIALWTDEYQFESTELSGLFVTTDTYSRPMDEYKPTVSPRSTYIKRTVGPFIYDPIIVGDLYSPTTIMSGLLVTLEVGLGAYGADASAYLLEEVPPSGFYVRNISPPQIRYPTQGTRPPTQQQIFHDPESGIMRPVDNFGLNTYATSIRWVNHDNHPQHNQRRSPRPTNIYTYELYPVYGNDFIVSDDFQFDGSGLFFGGSTSSGLFVTQSTGDMDGTISGVNAGLTVDSLHFYISGPATNSGSTPLYIRTVETFNSSYIGTASRTPELVDFIFKADGNAGTDDFAGIEYGPHLYMQGPLQYEDDCPLFITGPIGADVNFYTCGSDTFNSSGSYPSGLLLKTGAGHLTFDGSGNLFTIGPIDYSGSCSLYTQAGLFEPPLDLFTMGSLYDSGSISGYIKGPEFICSSGSFPYPYNPNDFAFPYGDPSPTLYLNAHIPITDSLPLYIGPLNLFTPRPLHLRTPNNIPDDHIDLFIQGFIGPSGTTQTFNIGNLYLEANDADYPYTAGGTKTWPMFLPSQSGNLDADNSWTMFLNADFTTPGDCNLYTYGHASGQPPHGIEISGSFGLVCSINPDDLTRIGYIPLSRDNDPWLLFMKCDPGKFSTTNLYMSGSSPVSIYSSGNLFIDGLFGQPNDYLPLYLLGVSGLFNNGPNGLALFLNAGTLVYNSSGNLYLHGY